MLTQNTGYPYTHPNVLLKKVTSRKSTGFLEFIHYSGDLTTNRIHHVWTPSWQDTPVFERQSP